MQRHYHYPFDGRSRRFLQERGAQNSSRLARAISFPDTRDFDLHAAMFTIVVHLADAVQASRLGVRLQKIGRRFASRRFTVPKPK